MKKKRVAKNLLAIFLMSFYFSCGRHDILDEQTERSAIEPVKTTLFADAGDVPQWCRVC
jgi:hypothetical protein